MFWYIWASPVAQLVKNLPAMQKVPWVWKIPWRMELQSTPVSLPGEFHGQQSLAGYSPWGHEGVGHGLATKQQNQSVYVVFESQRAF